METLRLHTDTHIHETAQAAEINPHSPPYLRFQYTQNLLQNRYHHFIMNLNQTEILQKFRELLKAQKLSDFDFARLIRRIEKWNMLKASFPVLFLDFLGISPDELQIALKADMRAFHQAMQHPHPAECFLIDMPTGSVRISLPAGMQEQDAIEMALNWHAHTPFRAKYIVVKDLRTTVIQPDGHTYMLSYPPMLSHRKGMYIPSQTGECLNGLKIP